MRNYVFNKENNNKNFSKLKPAYILWCSTAMIDKSSLHHGRFRPSIQSHNPLRKIRILYNNKFFIIYQSSIDSIVHMVTCLLMILFIRGLNPPKLNFCEYFNLYFTASSWRRALIFFLNFKNFDPRQKIVV